MITLMPNPFLNSVGLHPLPTGFTVASGGLPLHDATAEISSAASDAAAGTAAVPSPAQESGTAANPSMTMEEPQDAPAAVQSPLNLAETAGASGPRRTIEDDFAEMFRLFLPAQARLRPGTVSPVIVELCEDPWAWAHPQGLPEAPTLLFLETFPLNARIA
jgi:hypothetical protein